MKTLREGFSALEVGAMHYRDFDGMGLAELVRLKKVSPEELTKSAIAQIESSNPSLNAVVNKQYEQALDLAKRPLGDGPLGHGPFAGVPFLFKDLGAFQAGVPATHGSLFCESFRPSVQSEIVNRYLKAGFIPLGRTNTPELGLLPTTEPKLHGPARNPWNVAHTTGGSSGGSAAAVASRMTPIAHGGDGGGSIRIPSSCCGTFGLKPSEGRSPIGPTGGRAWHGLVVEHVVTRSVRDSAACLDVICTPQRGAPIHAPKPEAAFLKQLEVPVPRLRIGLIEEPYFNAQLHSDCREAVHDAARLCESLGHIVEPARFDVQGDKLAHAYTVVIAAETAAALSAMTQVLGRKPRTRELEPLTHVCLRGGHALSACDYAEAVRTMDEARRSVAATFEKYDIILTPTLALPPPRIGELDPPLLDALLMGFLRRVPIKSLLRIAFREIPKKAFRFTPYTFLFNLTGQPAMSVPLFWNKDGLPIGTHFIGEFGADGLLLRLAKQLDDARPFDARSPPQRR
jgi:amidase